MEMSSEIDKLKHTLEVADSEKRASEELFTSKLDALSLEHSHACEEVKRFQMELATLRKEREDLLLKIQQDTESNIKNELQMTKSQLQSLTEEKERLMLQIKELQDNEVQADDENLLRAQQEAEQLAKRFSDLEHKMCDDEEKSNKEKAKLRIRLRSTQGKLDAFRARYKEAIDEQQYMHKKFEEASNNLKDRLASYGLEVLNLKKQLAASLTR